MASISILEREKAVALQEALETVERMLGGEGASSRLTQAERDIQAQGMLDFKPAMVIAELTRVVADQHEQVADLQERIEELEGGVFVKEEEEVGGEHKTKA